MDTGAHLLIVEDDREIRDLVSRFLEKNGYRVSVAADGTTMERIRTNNRIDLVILDILLPGEDGLALCRRLRATSGTPIIMLTAMGEETDRIIGLEMGADDYLTKPFNVRELLARVRAVLRRSQQPGTPPGERPTKVMLFEGWRLDPALRQLTSPDGVRTQLTGGEFDLLVAFCQHPRRVLTRDQILDLTHGRGTDVFERSVDIQVSRLRRKIEIDASDPQIIRTVRSGGYLFTPQVRLQ